MRARLSGRVVRPDNDATVSVSGAWAVLHRVGSLGSGPVDSIRTDRSGRYQFTIPRPDTSAQYAVGVRYAGVAYLSLSVGPGLIDSRELGTIVVFDTSSTEPVGLSQRHLLVQPANPDGSIPVLELLIIRNAGTRTRVGADSTQPSWKGRLLTGALEVEVGESDLSQDAIVRRGDSIAVLAPLTPGEKQIVLTYVLPDRTAALRLPRQEPIGELDVMVADTIAKPVAGPLQDLGIASFENIQYRRLEAKDVPAGTPIVVRFSRRPARPGDFWWVVVAVSALGLVAAFVAWWRADHARAGLRDAEVLAARIAALDVALGSSDDAERRALREKLASELGAALAERNHPS
ncbi:MAG: hypothetical protein HY700_09000 [Gemmatimonadetes bacterium]|nr:hypothetical protein [Gemmatimonadota bacterium]